MSWSKMPLSESACLWVMRMSMSPQSGFPLLNAEVQKENKTSRAGL